MTDGTIFTSLVCMKHSVPKQWRRHFHRRDPIRGVSGTSAQGRKLWSVAAAWIDYDNDGYLDLIVSNYCDWMPGDRSDLRRAQ